MVRRTALTMLIVLAAGCGRGGTAPDSGSSRLPSPADTLTPADLDRLLAVVQSHGGAMPEFTPGEQGDDLDYQSRAPQIVSRIRAQFRTLFDVKRQGELWEEDEDWSRALAEQGLTGPRFAALVHSASCAVMRVRLEARVDVGRLVANARAEVRDLGATMDAIDEIPATERSRDDEFIRAQSALRLARAVALLEFAEMVKRVPAENCELVRRYSRRLKPLLPADGAEGLLAELKELGAPRKDAVTPAGHAE